MGNAYSIKEAIGLTTSLHGLRRTDLLWNTAFGKWHLGEDDEEAEDSKRRYKFPYGDFQNVHRCAVLSAESRAGQYKFTDIELAAAHLRGMLDALVAGKRSSEQEHASPT